MPNVRVLPGRPRPDEPSRRRREFEGVQRVAVLSTALVLACTAPGGGTRAVTGEWVIRSAESDEVGAAGSTFREVMKPIVGAVIRSYGEGVAELEARSGQIVTGWAFTNSNGADVEFFFEDSMTDGPSTLDLPCVFVGADRLVAREGARVLELERVSRHARPPSPGVLGRVRTRSSAKLRLDELWRQKRAGGD